MRYHSSPVTTKVFRAGIFYLIWWLPSPDLQNPKSGPVVRKVWTYFHPSLEQCLILICTSLVASCLPKLSICPAVNACAYLSAKDVLWILFCFRKCQKCLGPPQEQRWSHLISGAQCDWSTNGNMRIFSTLTRRFKAFGQAVNTSHFNNNWFRQQRKKNNVNTINR